MNTLAIYDKIGMEPPAVEPEIVNDPAPAADVADIVSAAMSRMAEAAAKPKKERKKPSPGWSKSRAISKTIRDSGHAPVENAAVRDAFEYYISLGEERSTVRVADDLGMVQSTVGMWCAKYNWVERALNYDRENADTITIESFGDQREKRRFGLKLIDKILKDTVKLKEDGTIESCKISAKSASDIRTLMTLREEILNPDKRSSSSTQQINANNAVFILKK